MTPTSHRLVSASGFTLPSSRVALSGIPKAIGKLRFAPLEPAVVVSRCHRDVLRGLTSLIPSLDGSANRTDNDGDVKFGRVFPFASHLNPERFLLVFFKIHALKVARILGDKGALLNQTCLLREPILFCKGSCILQKNILRYAGKRIGDSEVRYQYRTLYSSWSCAYFASIFSADILAASHATRTSLQLTVHVDLRHSRPTATRGADRVLAFLMTRRVFVDFIIALRICHDEQ